MGRALAASAAPATRRTIGSPSSFATSFVGSEPPPARNRDDSPAARMTPPILEPPNRRRAPTSLMSRLFREKPASTFSARALVTGRARLRTRRDLHQEPANAHRADVGVGDRHPRQHPLQDPVEPVLLGRPRTARRPDDRNPAAFGEEEQIPWIDRHAESFDAPANRLDRGRNYIAAICDGGGPERNERIAAVNQPRKRFRKRSDLMGNDLLGDDPRSRRIEARLEHAQGLCDD